MKKNFSFLVPLLFVFLCLLSNLTFAESEEVFENNIFKASAPVLIAGDFNMVFLFNKLEKAFLKDNISFSDIISGMLTLKYVKMDLIPKSLSTSYSNTLDADLILYFIEFEATDCGVSENFTGSSWEKMIHIDSTMQTPKISMILKSNSISYIYAVFEEFRPVDFAEIETQKKGGGEKILEELKKPTTPSQTTQTFEQQKQPSSTVSQKYTLTVIVTTPMSQVFNVFFEKDAYLVLEGANYSREEYLGKLAGAEVETVTFYDVPAGNYSLIFRWGGRNYKKSVTVDRDLEIDFMITYF